MYRYGKPALAFSRGSSVLPVTSPTEFVIRGHGKVQLITNTKIINKFYLKMAAI
jgi:hypothetical protein